MLPFEQACADKREAAPAVPQACCPRLGAAGGATVQPVDPVVVIVSVVAFSFFAAGARSK